MAVRGRDAREYLGVRDQVEVDAEEDREGLMMEREYEEASDTLGEAVRWEGVGKPVGKPEGRRGGPLIEGVKLDVRCREANVDPGPDIDRLDETFDS